MDKAQLKALIESKEVNFLRKLKYAGLNELEYWEKRPENFSREILERYFKSIDETRELFPEMEVRESDGGKYGATGFKWVFKLKDKFSIMGKSIDVYLKGFFVEEGDPRGVEIQSFKKSTNLKII
jgi:hypothetical protein